MDKIKLLYSRIFSNLSKQAFPVYASLAIVFGHYLLWVYGIKLIRIDNYFQMLQMPEAGTHFWRALWYLHSNPPGQSLLFGFARWIGHGDPYIFLTLLMPLLHAGSFLFFYFALKNFRVWVSPFLLLLLFFNPLLFTYFKYPFYCTFLFFNACLLLYLLSKFKRISFWQLALLVGVIVINALTRSTWHIYLITVLVGFLLYFAEVRHKWWLMAMLLLPLSVYVKNYYLFGNFETSSWLGLSLSRTQLPWLSAKEGTIASKPSLDVLSTYDNLYNTKDPRIAKFKDIPELNRGDWQDIRYLLVSEQYKKEVVPLMQWQWTVNAFINGYFIILKSPGDYFLLKKSSGGIQQDNKPIPFNDWLSSNRIAFRNIYFFIDAYPDLWHEHKPGDYWRFFNSYTVVYTLLLLLFAALFFWLPFTYRVMYGITVCTLVMYIVLDYPESNRMRMEVEPFLYFFTLVVISRLRTGHWPWNSTDVKQASIAP